MKFITEMWNGLLSWASQTNPMQLIVIAIIVVAVGFVADYFLTKVLDPLLFNFKNDLKSKEEAKKRLRVLATIGIAMTIGVLFLSILLFPDVDGNPIAIYFWQKEPLMLWVIGGVTISVMIYVLRSLPQILFSDLDKIPACYRKVFKI